MRRGEKRVIKQNTHALRIFCMAFVTWQLQRKEGKQRRNGIRRRPACRDCAEKHHLDAVIAEQTGEEDELVWMHRETAGVRGVGGGWVGWFA